MLSPCSHDGGSPVIWKFRWVAVEPISSFLSSPWIMLNINLVLETCVSISSCFVHEAYVWMKVVTSFNSCASDASCRRGFEKVNVVSFGIIPNQSCIRAKYSVVWRFATSMLYVYPSTPSHWLSCSKIKESVQGELFGLPRVETLMSLMMVPPPELGSVLL